MGKSELKLESIRQSLLKNQQQSEATEPEPIAPQWAPPTTTTAPPSRSPAGSAAELNAAVATLRQRSAGVDPALATAAPAASDPTPATTSAELDLHRHRLQQQARAINDLARQQEAAIQAFKRSSDSLAWCLRRNDHAHGWRLEQFCQLESAAVTQVIQDESGAFVLTQAAIDLYEDERQASQTAQALRERKRPHAQSAAATREGWMTLVAEPLAALEALWQAVTGTWEARSRLTALDLLLWLGGGVIARQALELLLAAVPQVWPLLVGATVGAVALALYRLMTAQRTDLGFVVRLFLALAGLVIGGQL